MRFVFAGSLTILVVTRREYSHQDLLLVGIKGHNVFMSQNLSGLLALTRWKEHVLFVVPLTIIGGLLALSEGGVLDERIIFALFGNIATVSYAFMVNDMEDAPDDARDAHSNSRNPIASGKISVTSAQVFLWFMAAIALAMFLYVGHIVFAVGVMTLVLSHLYSWRKVRLKALPITDIVAHVLMLSTLLLLTGYAVYSNDFSSIWLIISGVTLFSAYGQIYNQLRDIEADRQAGLRNTTILIGEKRAHMLKNAFIALAALCLGTAIYQGYFPTWLIIPAVCGVPLVLYRKSHTDMRGSIAIDASGALQFRLMILINIITASWLLRVFIQQVI